MNEQNNQTPNHQQSVIEDLTVQEAQAAEVKGGPIFMKIDGVDGDVTSKVHEAFAKPVPGGWELGTNKKI